MPAKFDCVNNSNMQEQNISNSSKQFYDDDIVISGISGRFPESSNVEEFMQHLLNGTDMVTDNNRRWTTGLYGLPSRSGQLKDLTSFDATFFGVHAKQAHTMDPQIRILHELTYEAIVDAGINPTSIRGSKVGVYIGVSDSTSIEHAEDIESVSGYSLLGCCRSMFSNRISYSFDFTGPSFTLDTACSSSLYALDQAMTAIRTGQCDAAIIGGVHLTLKPEISLQFHRLKMLSVEGACKAFDSSGNGYVRSEAAVSIFIQKVCDAKRIYSTVVNCKTNADGYKEQGITYPSGEMQYNLLCEIYHEAKVNPSDVSYIEAHGTGTKIGDPEECNAIAKFFCNNRKNPLLIGSVKSNMGHSEPASGLCSIVKVLIAMETNIIPGNLHFKSPNPDIPALNDGRLQVVDKSSAWKGGIVAVNSFGFGGANAHVILKSHSKPKIISLDSKYQKIVGVSGRTEEAVHMFLNKIKIHERDNEYIGMIQEMHNVDIHGHSYRGYQILDENENIREVTEVTDKRRPIWYVLSGMGTQWPGMGKDLFSIDIFQQSIRRCAEVLKPYNVDLMQLIQNGSEEQFDNVLNCFVCIAAIQVALIDVLSSIDIHPDGIVGHSVGELGCAYADGTFTAEQTILAAYWRGKCILDTKLAKGAMAAVGLKWEEIKERCPDDIYPACHNSIDSVTISGPEESVTKFVEILKKENIFAKKVNSSGCAFHSKYFEPVGPKLREALEKVIVNPKKRSSRWISSSISDKNEQTLLSVYSSAAYHANNLLSPVLFYEALQKVPSNAIVIEIAPHCLLQAILKRTLPKTVNNISLHKKDHADNMKYFLNNLGLLYLAGGQPKFSKLYTPIKFPVSRGTPMINSVIGWNHSTPYHIIKSTDQKHMAGESTIKINLKNKTDSYLSGHIIDDRILFPATGYLFLVWKIFAKMHNKSVEEMPIVIENTKFLRATIIPKNENIKFVVNIFYCNGAFEVSESGGVVAYGKIRILEETEKEQTNLPIPTVKQETGIIDLDSYDIYKNLYLRGYEYRNVFKGILHSDNRGQIGELKWIGNWISYLDTMLQFAILSKNTKDLYLPTSIHKISINPEMHQAIGENISEGRGIPVYNYSDIGIVKSGGIELKGLSASLIRKRQKMQNDAVYQTYNFLPYISDQPLNDDPKKAKFYAITVLMNIIRENLGLHIKLYITEVAENRMPEQILLPTIADVLEYEYTFSQMQVVTKMINIFESVLKDEKFTYINKDIHTEPVGQNICVIVAANVLTNNDNTMLKNLSDSVKSKGFIFLEESNEICLNHINKFIQDCNLIYLAKQVANDKNYILLKKKEQTNPVIIQVERSLFTWIDELKKVIQFKDEKHILLVNKTSDLTGIIGFINCIRQEYPDITFQYLDVQDPFTGDLQLDSENYKGQIENQVVANIFKNGQWGCYHHLPLDYNKNSLNPVEHAYVNFITRGDLSSLTWIESPLKYYSNKDTDKELCYIYYAPLNFRDVMLATGRLPPDALPGNLVGQECILGLEFSGSDSSGRRVMGIVPAQGLATTVLADPIFLWEIPSKWTLEQAATIPVAYATSYYALYIRGQIKSGESVLIHAGSGGVGQASIAIALHTGCNVFTTVGSDEKREFLKKRFPRLTDKNIGYSRDTSFEQWILKETAGHGVDVVLNSLSDEKLQASIRCLANGGRFLEIGKYDLAKNTPLGMGLFLKNTSFHGILLDALFDAPEEEKKQLVNLLNQGIVNGTVIPLNATVFTDQQLEQAFRYMATGKHIGKVVLKIRNEESTMQAKPNVKLIPAIQKLYFDPYKSYVIIGGLGEVGLELTSWMITRGAKHFVLVSTSAVKTGYQSFSLRRWRENGINVMVAKANVLNISQIADIFTMASKYGPVGGIFNLAAVLRDGLLENQTIENFKIVGNPKIEGTINLDVISRKICHELDYFVCFSSVSAGKGNIGQANYGFANSFMERIIEKRNADGLPGLAIQWGAIGDVGLAIKNLGDNDVIVANTKPQRLTSFFNTIDIFLRQSNPILLSCVIPDKVKSNGSTNNTSITEIIANILGIKSIRSINQNQSLSDLGMDSLMATEIKQIFERNYEIFLSPQEIRNITFAEIAQLKSDYNKTADIETNYVDDFFNYNSTNEIILKECLVQKKTKSQTGSSIFAIHAYDGTTIYIDKIAAQINRPVWGLQCTRNASFDNLTVLAKYYIQEMEKVQTKGPYTILGYSYGACLAFEIAILLQKHGEQSNLILIDGSPDFELLICSEIAKELSINDTDSDTFKDLFKKSLAVFTKSINSRVDLMELYNILKGIKSDEEAVEIVVKIANSKTFTSDEIKESAYLFYKKIKAILQYKKPDVKYEGPVTLFKADNNSIKLDSDYGLSKICKQAIKIEKLNGNRKTILTGKMANHIAKYLEK